MWSHKKSQNWSRISLELFLWAQPCSTWGTFITCLTRFENRKAVRINETHLLLPRFAGDWRVIKSFGGPWLKASKLHTEILNWRHISWRGSGFLNRERERKGQKIRARVSEQGNLKVPHYVGHTSPAGSRSWAELVPHWLSIESPIANVLIYFPGKGQEGYIPSFWSSAYAPALSRLFPHWTCLQLPVDCFPVGFLLFLGMTLHSNHILMYWFQLHVIWVCNLTFILLAG